MLRKRFLTVILSLVSPAIFSTPLCGQLPVSGNVVAGNATISASPNSINIASQSDRTVIDWQSFSIGQGANVHFNQPNASSAVLNRVTGLGVPTLIDGLLTSNGQVFLSNPNGIVVGPTGVINTNGFTATTFEFSKQEFMRGGNLSIAGSSRNAIVNQGTISTGDSGTNLIAQQVINGGRIDSQGTINLATGGTITLMNGAVYSQADIKTIASGVSETASLIRNSGELRATGALSVGGSVYLVNPGGTIINHGTIMATREVPGTLSSGNRTTGGNVRLDAKEIAIQSESHINASGANGGGEIRVGSLISGSDSSSQAERITIDAGSTMDVSAIETGNGGTIVISTNVQNPPSTTEVHGTLLAKGGSLGGDGGHIETSGHQLNVSGIIANASAILGKAGTWLLDPTDLSITTSPTTGASNIQNTDIESALNTGTNVTLQTSSMGTDDGNINVNASITKSSGGEATLTLKAHNSIYVNSEILSTSNKLHLILNSNSENSGGGTVYVAGDIQTNGGNLIVGGGLDPQVTSAIGDPASGFGLRISGAQLAAGGGDILIRGTGDRTVFNRVGAYGVDISDSSVTTTGNGRISIFGDAGGVAVGGNSPFNIGIAIGGQSTISSDRGDIQLVGKGGGVGTTGLGLSHGIYFVDQFNTITSVDGNIHLEGTGGSGAYSVGLLVITDNTIRTTGQGNLTLVGKGGADFGSAGVFLESSLSAGNGNISVDGIGANAGGMTSDGVYMGYMIAVESQGGSISIAGSGGVGPDSHGILLDGQLHTYRDGTQISLTSDNIQIASGSPSSPTMASITAGTNGGTVIIRNRDANTRINLGGADSLGVLGISANEISRINARNLEIGSPSSGDMLVSADVLSNSATLSLRSGHDLRLERRIDLTDTSGTGGFRAQADGHLSIGTTGQIATANGDIDLISSRFTNESPNVSLVPSGLGKYWRIWSANSDPFSGTTPDQIGNLDFDFKEYRAQYGASVPHGLGNGLLYQYAPTVNGTFIGPVTKYYDGTTTAILSDSNFVVDGLVGGDLLVLPTGTYDTAKTENHKVVSIPDLSAAMNQGKPVYGYDFHTANNVIGDASITWSPAYLREFNQRIAELNSRGMLDKTIPYDPVFAGLFHLVSPFALRK